MITETPACTRCGANDLARNGKTRAGKQKYHCRACGHYGTLNAGYGYSEERKAEILKAYHERPSLRGLERTFGVARQTVATWLIPTGHKKKANSLPPLVAGGAVPAPARSSPGSRVIAAPIAAGRFGWPSQAYRQAYASVFGENHQAVGQESGQAAHVERWNNTLRQRLGRFVRKSLAFSKKDEFHRIALQLFIHEYNLACVS